VGDKLINQLTGHVENENKWVCLEERER